MKIALAQLNFQIANFDCNCRKIIHSIEKASKQDADIVIFSELGICGYPPRDLLERRDFIESCNSAIEKISKYTDKTAVIIGAPTINESPNGKNLFNSAYFIYKGKIKFIQHKTLLPTYDIFDEYRYFEQNTEFNVLSFKGKKIAITICEDLWENQPTENSFEKVKLYTKSPITELVRKKPDFLINISASPFSYSKVYDRKNLLSSHSLKHKIPIIYVNQVGAHAELIFDGDSKVFNSDGELVKQLKMFEEDFTVFDLNLDYKKITHSKFNDIQLIHDALILGIKDYFKKTGHTKAIIGLSGGLDSAVTTALASKALGNKNVHVLLMPSLFSSKHSLTDAKKLANNLNISHNIIEIETIYNQFANSLNPIFKDLPFDNTEENIQARIRGILLMALANKYNYILLNTSNKSEGAVGYATLYGDMNGGLSVLGDVYKTKIYALAKYLNKEKEIIPENTILKPPSAELRPNQLDTDSLPEYAVLDKILFMYIEQSKGFAEITDSGFDKEIVKKIIRLVNINEYKRFQTPPILRVSTKAFGFGRKIPLVAFQK